MRKQRFRPDEGKLQAAYQEWLRKVQTILPTGKVLNDVQKALQGKQIPQGCSEKNCCNCAGHQDDPRYYTFRASGPCVIFRCFSACPFCDYQPGTGGGRAATVTHHGATIRKHITSMHAGKPGFEGLWAVPDRTIKQQGLNLTFKFDDPNRAIFMDPLVDPKVKVEEDSEEDSKEDSKEDSEEDSEEDFKVESEEDFKEESEED